MYPAPSLRLNEAANVSIICKGNGSALSWYGPTGAIVNSTRTSIYTVSTNNSITSNLFIASLCITDSGNYTCTNGVERVSASIFVLGKLPINMYTMIYGTDLITTYTFYRILDIHIYSSVYPRIGYTPQVQTFTEGQQACVICTVERGNARDEPTLEYLRSPATSPVPALNSTMCLCIPHVTLGDAGSYQYIVGVNDVGTFNRSIQVNVLPATQPDKKGESVYCVETTRTRDTLIICFFSGIAHFLLLLPLCFKC